jgi:hypothetical protein
VGGFIISKAKPRKVQPTEINKDEDAYKRCEQNSMQRLDNDEENLRNGREAWLLEHPGKNTQKHKLRR